MRRTYSLLPRVLATKRMFSSKVFFTVNNIHVSFFSRRVHEEKKLSIFPAVVLLLLNYKCWWNENALFLTYGLWYTYFLKGHVHINLMFMRKWGHWICKTDACFHFSFSDIKLNRPRSGHKNVQSDHQILVAPITRSLCSDYQILMHFQIKFNAGIWWPEHRDLVARATLSLCGTELYT